jgi:hypothetical protein
MKTTQKAIHGVKHIIRLSVLILALLPAFAGVPTTASLVKQLDSESDQTLDILDIYTLLRVNNFVVTLEAGLDNADKQIKFKAHTKITFEELFRQMHTMGYDVEKGGDTIAIYNPEIRKLGQGYLLNVSIPDLKLENVLPGTAITIIAEKFHLDIRPSAVPIGFYKGKPVSLNLQNITVREALSQIAKAAGMMGWLASPGIPDQSHKEHIGVVVSFD